MTLLDSKPELSKDAKKAVKALAVRESAWREHQKELKAINQAKKSEKAKGVHAYQN